MERFSRYKVFNCVAPAYRHRSIRHTSRVRFPPLECAKLFQHTGFRRESWCAPVFFVVLLYLMTGAELIYEIIDIMAQLRGLGEIPRRMSRLVILGRVISGKIDTSDVQGSSYKVTASPKRVCVEREGRRAVVFRADRSQNNLLCDKN